IIYKMYNPVQEIVQSLERQSDKPQLQRMVLVTFPHPGVKLPAFVTATCRDIETNKTLLAVYVPTTPVPTSGFFLLVPEEEVTELNWNTEQTLQAVMSGGLTSPRAVSFYKGGKGQAQPDAAPGVPPVGRGRPPPPPDGRPHPA